MLCSSETRVSSGCTSVGKAKSNFVVLNKLMKLMIVVYGYLEKEYFYAVPFIWR